MGENVSEEKNEFEAKNDVIYDVSMNHMRAQDKSESIFHNREFRKGYVASTATMCLGIMGGAVLPIPWAFSITGIGAGLVIAGLVCWANVFTSDLLIKQCYKSGASDYEELAYATGGRFWLFVTRVSIVILLLGSIIGSLQQTGEAAITAMLAVWNEDVPDWLLYKEESGWVPMVVFTVLIIFPLSMVKQMRSLEYAGFAGFAIVLWLLVVVIVQSIGHGLPAIGSGEFRGGGFSNIDNISQAVSVFGFGFYIQPMMMPMLAEMPGAPRQQARILSWAMRFSVVAFAFMVYCLIGFFGASWFGESTEGNIIQNRLMGGGVAQGILNMFMSVYLAICIPALEFPCRLIINNWLPGDKKVFPMLRHLVITSFIYILSLLVAMLWGEGSANLFVVTAATGVLMVSYVLPVGNHFLLYFNRAKCQHEAMSKFKEDMANDDHSHYGGHPISKFMDSQAVPLGEALTPGTIEAIGKPGILTYRRIPSTTLEFVYEGLHEIFLPILIVILGCFSSVMALWSTFK